MVSLSSLFLLQETMCSLFPAGSNNLEASELYHRVAQTADEVYNYVEEVQTAPTLHISGLSEKIHLLADLAAQCWLAGSWKMAGLSACHLDLGL